MTTYSYVKDGYVGSATSLSFTPAAVGNLLVLFLEGGTGSPTVSGGPVDGNGWQQLAVQPGTSYARFNLLMGRAGQTTAGTISVSGAALTIHVLEFSSSLGSASVWASDSGYLGGLDNSTSSTTLAFKTGTPTAGGSLVVGAGDMNATISSPSAGYTMVGPGTANATALYNLSASGAQAPTFTGNAASASDSIIGTFTASAPATNTAQMLPLLGRF